ncbi:transposase [Sphingobacterium oryzagri]|uniref:transposase n=1 Tax=Sphingobacterium oryzagri TaxID=3025669 RepID=UPI003D185D26
MDTRGISGYVEEIYAMDISAVEISTITEKVIPAIKEWRNRPLESIYLFLFLDCMHYKFKDNGSIQTCALYNILG